MLLFHKSICSWTIQIKCEIFIKFAADQFQQTFNAEQNILNDFYKDLLCHHCSEFCMQYHKSASRWHILSAWKALKQWPSSAPVLCKGSVLPSFPLYKINGHKQPIMQHCLNVYTHSVTQGQISQREPCFPASFPKLSLRSMSDYCLYFSLLLLPFCQEKLRLRVIITRSGPKLRLMTGETQTDEALHFDTTLLLWLGKY